MRANIRDSQMPNLIKIRRIVSDMKHAEGGTYVISVVCTAHSK